MKRTLIPALLLALPGMARAQASPEVSRPTLSGVFTPAQATDGKSIYQFSCANCHSPASHSGQVFAAKWEGRLLWDLYRFVSEQMPKSEPGSLAPKEYASVVAYLLKLNGMPSGATEMSSDSTALKQIRIVLKRDSTP